MQLVECCVMVAAGLIVRWLPKLKGEGEVEDDHLFDDQIYWEVSEAGREGRGRKREGVCVCVCAIHGRWEVNIL